MKSNDNTTNNDSSENSNNKRGRSHNKRRNYSDNTKNAGNNNPVNEDNPKNPKNRNPQSQTPNKNNNSARKNRPNAPKGNGNQGANKGNAIVKRNSNNANGNSNHHNGSLSGHETPTVFERFATNVSKAAGSTTAFICAFLVVVGWAVTGPFFDFSETWQLVINTGTTIITFLMVFLIQKAQNKDSLAIQLKLNELVASHAYSSNRLVDIENMTEEEMIVVQKYYRSLSELSKKDEKLQTSHSIEEAEQHHAQKSGQRAKRHKPRNFKGEDLD